MNDSELGERKELPLPLKGISKGKRKRGRPLEITDEELRRRLADLHFVLDQAWGGIGIGLFRAGSIADVQEAFKATSGFTLSRLDLFRTSDTEETSLSALRELRRHLAAARKHERHALQRRQKADEKVQELLRVSGSQVDLVTEGHFRAFLEEWAVEIEQARADLDFALNICREKHEAVVRQEAYFAQSELLKFVHRGKARFTPMHLARAMAGLPRISARISFERCGAFRDKINISPEYLKLTGIRAAFDRKRLSNALCSVDGFDDALEL